MTVYPELGDYCEVAAQLLGAAPGQIEALPGAGSIDSALAAPQIGYGEHEAYPALIEKAAVLINHLGASRLLAGANVSAAFLTVWLFMELNGRPFTGPDPEADAPMLERIGLGEVTIGEITVWLEQRTSA